MKKIYLRDGYGANGKAKHMMADMDMFELAPIAEYKHTHEGKVADEQRLLDKKHVETIVVAVENGEVNGFWFPIIGVSGDMEIKEDMLGNKYIELPEEEEEIAKYAQYFQFIDGQHRVWAFTSEYCLCDKINSFVVSVCLLDHPTKQEMIKAFIELNGKGKSMDKTLLLDFRAKIGDLPADQKEMYDLLTMLDEDEQSPLYHRIDWGNRGKAAGNYSAKTIIEVACGTTKKKAASGLITTLNNNGYKTIERKYKVVLDYLQAVHTVENMADSTLGDPKARRLNNQQIAYIFHMCGQAVKMMKREDKRMTRGNFVKAYKFILKEAMNKKRLSGSDFSTMHVVEAKDRITVVNYNRWGGRANVNRAIMHDSRWLQIVHKKMSEEKVGTR